MRLAFTYFNIKNEFEGMPHLMQLGHELRSDTSYHHVCARRKDDSYLFKLTLKGSGVFSKNNEIVDLPVGRAFLCRINDPAVEYFYPDQSLEPWEFIYVAIEGDDFKTMVDKFCAARGHIFDVSLNHPLIKKFISFDSEPRVIHQSAAENCDLLMQLYSLLMKCSEQEEISHPLVARSCRYIKNNFQNQLNVTSLASRFQVSREYLTRLFKRELGVTPHQFISAERMKLARRLLQNPDLAIRDVAYAVGIAPEHFSNYFRKHTGQRASDFRRS